MKKFLLCMLVAFLIAPQIAGAKSRSIKAPSNCSNPKTFAWIPFPSEQYHIAVTWKKSSKSIIAAVACADLAGSTVPAAAGVRDGGSLTITNSIQDAATCAVGFCGANGAVSIVFNLVTGRDDPTLRPASAGSDETTSLPRGLAVLIQPWDIHREMASQMQEFGSEVP